MINSGLVPGAAAICVLMRRLLNIDLTEAQTNILWAECRVFLEDAGLHRTVAASQQSYFWCLDPVEEGELISVLGLALVKTPWPTIKDGFEKTRVFHEKVASTIARRGYYRAPVQISMLAG